MEGHLGILTCDDLEPQLQSKTASYMGMRIDVSLYAKGPLYCFTKVSNMRCVTSPRVLILAKREETLYGCPLN